MAVIVENGTGVAGANSYVTAAYVGAYLTERGRALENGWATSPGAAENAAVVKGTDYVELAFRQRFRGVKQWTDISLAKATWTPTAQPVAGTTVTVGTQVYTFRASLLSANDVLIGDTLSEVIENLVGAINADEDLAGIGFHASTVANVSATASVFIDDTMVVYALATGTAGNSVAVATDVTGSAWNGTTLFGGSSVARPQPLSFPRKRLFDRDGLSIVGVPTGLKNAVAEYAARARAAALTPDPTADALGGSVTELFEKVGPIETRNVYLPGTANSGALTPYPAADRLLLEYLDAGGGTYR